MISIRRVASAALCVGALACSGVTTPPVPPPAATTTQFQLGSEMRKLWTDHVFWTRTYLISAIAGLPDADAAATRLLQNQIDLGNAIKPFYGDAAGDALAALLRTHITIATELVTAAKASQTAAFTDAKARWYANADAIAQFLVDAAPALNIVQMKEMMRTHLDETLVETTARLQADWSSDGASYDVIVAHILNMSDTISAAIGAKFPEKIAAPNVSARHQDLHRAMRRLWEDHAEWTRLYVISAAAALPDSNFIGPRLLQNQVDIGSAIKPYYGDVAGDALAGLLKDHIMIATEVVLAAKGNDAPKLADAQARWSANGDRIAVFLSTANPAWTEASMKQMMSLHLAQTTTEVTARLRGDWAADVAAYDAVELHIREMADMLSDGLATQFPALVF